MVGSTSTTQIPNEVLLIILADFLPLHGREFVSRGIPRYTEGANRLEREYHARVRSLASLRAVCSRWYQVITPVLYSTFVFVITPQSPLTPQLVAFRSHSRLIQHLIIKSDHQWHVSTAHPDAELIETCLGECTNLRTLQLVNTEEMFLRISSSDRRRIFLSNRRKLPELTSIIIGSRANDHPRLTTTMTLVGLGPDVCSKLTNLEISVRKLDGNGSRSTNLPASFPNIVRLVLRWESQVPELYKKLLSRIVRKYAIQRTGPEDSKPITAVIPLRELVLEVTNLLPDVEWAKSLLSINSLGSTLSSLDIRLRYIQYYYPRVPQPLHNITPFLQYIIARCTSLTTFRHFSPHPTDLLAPLPERLEEIGIQVTTYRLYDGDSPDPAFILQNLKPMIDWVRSGKLSNDLHRIRVTFVTRHSHSDIIATKLPMADDWYTLREECLARGISLIQSI